MIVQVAVFALSAQPFKSVVGPLEGFEFSNFSVHMSEVVPQ